MAFDAMMRWFKPSLRCHKIEMSFIKSGGVINLSLWTHIVATMEVDTLLDDEHIGETITKMLEQAPRITGSEHDADVFVNVLSGCNHTIFTDCDHCEHNGVDCDALRDITPEQFVCKVSNYQSCVAITVVGDLRDRVKSETHKEWKAFQKYIAKKNGLGFWIRNCTCRIEGV